MTEVGLSSEYFEYSSEYDYRIRSAFPAQPESPAAIGAKFLATLDALSRADPIFADWMVSDLQAFATSPIAEARPASRQS